LVRRDLFIIPAVYRLFPDIVFSFLKPEEREKRKRRERLMEDNTFHVNHELQALQVVGQCPLVLLAKVL
jgi:hypothetical protein